MSKKHKLIIGIITMLIITVSAGCGGPEQKKAKFFNKGKALCHHRLKSEPVSTG